jgi:hypothetical protein
MVFDRHVLALDEAGVTQALAKCGDTFGFKTGRRTTEEPYHRLRRLLHAHHERPGCRAAEKRYELAPSQSIK